MVCVNVKLVWELVARANVSRFSTRSVELLQHGGSI